MATARGQRGPRKGQLYLQVCRDKDEAAARSWRWAQTLRARGRACEREHWCYQPPPGVGATSSPLRPLTAETVLSRRLWFASRGRQRHAPGGRRAQHPCTSPPPTRSQPEPRLGQRKPFHAKSALEF